MKDEAVITQAQANAILEILSEIPIKYLVIVQQVQHQLQALFVGSHATVSHLENSTGHERS